MAHVLSQVVPNLVDIARIAGWLLLLSILFVPLEQLWSLREADMFRPGVFTDVGYFVLNSLVPKILLVIPMSALVWAVHAWMPGRVLAFTSHLPFWERFIAASIIAEIGFYWGHRWSHEIPFLWRFHAVHHSAEHIDWLVNVRAHPVDMVFTRLCGLGPLFALGLAGSDSVDSVPLAVVLFGSVWGFFIHANVRWRLGWLEQIIATPAFHHWHHTNDDKRDLNYSSTLPWLDRIFGTYHMPKHAWPTEYGVDDKLSPSIIDQLIDPLLPRRRRTERPAPAPATAKPPRAARAMRVLDEFEEERAPPEPAKGRGPLEPVT